MSNDNSRRSSPAKAPVRRRPYRRPTIRLSEAFETRALVSGCGSSLDADVENPDCNFDAP